MTPRARAVQIRFTDGQLRLIALLMAKTGIETRAGLIKHAIAQLAHEQHIPIPKPRHRT